MTARLPAIDYAKTIGIALVVLGHVSGQGGSEAALYIRNCIYQFHVPLFFFLSGYCFKEQDSWGDFLVKRIKGLYLPFVIWNLIFFAVYIIAHRMNGETIILVDSIKHTIKILLGIAITPLGGASWFLITLFLALVLYKLLLMLCEKAGKHFRLLTLIVSLLISLAGMKFYLPFGWDAAFVALCFVCAGHITRSYNLLDRIDSRLVIPLVCSGLTVVCLCARTNHPDLTLHQFGRIPIYLIAAFSGIVTILLSCQLLLRIHPLPFLGEWGQKTIWILLGHFAAFKLVTIIQIIAFGLPWNTVFTHPCNYVGGGWGILYFLMGFFVPLLLSKIQYPRLCARSHS